MEIVKINTKHYLIFLRAFIAFVLIPICLLLLNSSSSINTPIKKNSNVNCIIQKQNLNAPYNVLSQENSKEQNSVLDKPEHSYPNINNSSDIFNKNNLTVYYSGSSFKKQVALTFDDGPDKYYTDKILEILKQYNVMATFFVIGENAKTYPSVIKRIDKEGHAIGNHTYDHANLNHLSAEQICSEINKTDNILDSIIGHHLAILRPPYGISSNQTIKIISTMGYKIIDWNVDTRDWAGTPPSKIMYYVKKQTCPGAIILHHCSTGKAKGLDNTLNVLPDEINTLKSKGYQFVTVPELLNIN